jgi:predicted amidohydrolase
VNISHIHPSVQLRESGVDHRRGNLLGIQPWMTPADYISESALFFKLSSYFEAAAGQGWLNPRTIAVFPEYLGTWLVVANAGRAVGRVKHLNRAMLRLALRYPARFAGALHRAEEPDRVAASLFRARASAMASAYPGVFSRLARTFGVTVVAGSTVLPSPRVDNGELVIGDGPLYGVSAIFAPDGGAHPHLIHKLYPTSAELPFLTPGSAIEQPVFETPAGRLGVLICADSWYPEPYRQLCAQGVELIAVPSYIAKRGCWAGPWGGYDGASMPQDVDPRDVGRLTEAEAWRVYALAGRFPSGRARAGINVFLAGELWDLGAEGASMMITPAEGPVEAKPASPALLNLWL